MTSMREKIARAIYEKRNGAGVRPWSTQPGTHRLPYLMDADAALDALLEPTEGMFDYLGGTALTWHFHDLRHEGVSRLFEMGKGIPDVALVSAHRSWSSLQRYSHIRQRGDKYAGWKWLGIAVERAGRISL